MSSGRIVRNLIIAATGLLLSGVAWGQEVRVAPGTMIRWPGEDLEGCGQGERRWQPMGDECWYAIDLLKPEGRVTVSRWQNGEQQQQSLEVGPYPYEVQHITLKDDSQVHLSAENLRRVQQENALIAGLWGRETARRFSLPLGAPLEVLPEGGRFGSRRFFNNEPRSPHTGTDFAAKSGTPIQSVAAGTVALKGDFFFPGKSVFIDHGDGLISMYFHLSGIAVEDGEGIDRGEILGLVGESGRATGPHLHFGVRWHGARVDPRLLLDLPETVPAIQ